MMKFAFLLLCACCSAFAVHEVEQVSAHNIGLSESLLGAQNPCARPLRQPTWDDPSYAAGVKIIAVIPQVGNTTSDLALPKALWSWFASYPSSISLSAPSGNGCPDSRISLYARGKPHFTNARLTYDYGGNAKEVSLSETGPNPAVLDLNGSLAPGRELSGLYANLSLRLAGEISIEYSYSKADYVIECSSQEGRSGCACMERNSVGATEYRQQYVDSKNFLVETGPVQEVWLSPPVQKRLDGNQTGKLLLFSRRMPSRITFLVDDRLYGENLPYRFRSGQGDCGSQTVEAEFSPLDRGVAVQKSEEVASSQLVDVAGVYVPIYAQFDWNEAAGRKGAEVRYEDWFSNVMYFPSNFSIRNPAAFAKDQSGLAMGIRQGNDSVSPAAYPAPPSDFPVQHLSPIAVLLALLIILAVHWIFVHLGDNRE